MFEERVLEDDEHVGVGEMGKAGRHQEIGKGLAP